MTDTVNVPPDVIERIKAHCERLEADGSHAVTHGTPSARSVRYYNYDLARDLRSLLAAAPKAEPVSATDDLIDRFAAALKSKLNKAAEKYGYNDDWMRPEWREDLVRHLIAHVEKGDPRDVAAYCAFAWHHGWSVKPEAPKVEQEPFGYTYETIGGDWVLRQGEAIGDTHGKPLYTHPAPASDELLAAAEECLSRMLEAWPTLATTSPVQRLQHAIAKHKGAAVVSTWMPIETAPRDGTEFQARIPGHGEDNVIAWVDGVTEGENGPCGSWMFTREQEPPACWSDGYWWAENEDGQQSVTPTHWKPIADAMMEARK